MSPSRSRFVTLCQQLLALGVVLAVLTPAASVISLDVVRQAPEGSRAAGLTGPALLTPPRTAAASDLAAYARGAQEATAVPTAPVDPDVREYALTPPAGSSARAGTLAARAAQGPAGTRITSAPQRVTGYGAVGVTWQHGEQVDEDDLALVVRTRTDGRWGAWSDLEYHDDHGPDPDSAEARRARPGTDPVLVGTVDEVQVRVDVARGTAAPDDMSLSVIDPGEAADTVSERPALDTSTLDGPATPGDAAPAPETAGAAGEEQLALSAAEATPRPQIFSRAQWGADERMRSASSLRYGEVHAGFVHHTVNANDYTREQVPALIRGIYAYHTRSQGWSDIGYNYLVDRFGRIWEGRYGGIDRAVVGAHTLGYNDYSFAMSAIGNYDVAQPSQAVVQAYGALFAWKLSLHGVDASSGSQLVGSKRFPAINGHRDAGSTACPGRYLYARLPEIRRLAAATQTGFAGRQLDSNLADTAHPDVVLRRASDGRLLVLPTGGLTRLAKPRAVAGDWSSVDAVVASPDLTGDGLADLVARSADGTTGVRAGDGAGGFAAAPRSLTALAGHDLLTAAGDLDGDGRADLLARQDTTGRLDAFLGNGAGGFRRVDTGLVLAASGLLAAPGDLDGDGVADLVVRDAAGSATLHRGVRSGTGAVSFAAATRLAGDWSRWDVVTAAGDWNRDGRADLLVRRAGGAGFVMPSRGDGGFGHVLGPVDRVAGLDGIVSGASLTGDAAPDVLARRGDALVVLANPGTVDTAPLVDTGVRVPGADAVMNVGDWDGDGLGDVVVRNAATGVLMLRRGDGQGRLGKALRIGTGFKDVGLLAAVGDTTGDGRPDLMGQPRGGSMRIYPGAGLDGLGESYVARSAITATQQVGAGLWDADGAPDSLLRNGSRLTLYPGNGPGGLTDPRTLGLDVTAYDWVVGVSDVGLTGHPDLVVREKRTGYLWLLRASADGFEPRRFLAEGMGDYDLAG